MPTLATNKYARSDYDLVQQFEGGLALTGAEVKAAKKGNLHLRGSFMRVRGGELWLKNTHIGHYAPAGPSDDYDPIRERKVLVHKKELRILTDKTHAQGLTIVPIRVYTKGALVKVGFALARGKRKHEKRDALKKRDLDRQAREEMKKTRFAD
ncbi:SsrA-binding protein SmpB [Candidatus Uhrbacteria bacterium]|jgi:SsrA-binding protein|nr:SsrA-binding protein SmpB [Candidatus Uhrbacteria bacterium]